MTLEWVKQRQAFGGTLWDQQVVRHKISLLAAELEAVRQLMYHAAWLDEQGIDCVKETSMVKVLAAELNNRVMSIGGGASEVMIEKIAKRLG